MALIEFKNLETEKAFMKALEPTEEQQKLKRGLYLMKHAHYWSGI
jgi:hypothetical protein